MSKDWRVCAQHILDTIQKLERIQQRGELAEDEVLYDASLRNLQTLSEATHELPDAAKQIHPEIPWKEISGFRNILVYNYLGDIDAQTVMKVLQNDLPPLRSAVRGMLDADAKPKDNL
ncbi:MAG: DUF86 domain-containing protein [Nitrosospira sp.]|nr:DUF86 domain-containing protein [Nitrosospira sp.]MDN5935183.1 DUF86 domain-containing protein [Nitrosospira sp.]